MTEANASETLRVQVTSIDGNLTHPFKATDTMATVRHFAYERLVQNKNQIAEATTWIEFGGSKQDEGTELASLVDPQKNKGNAIDVVVALVWPSQGGR
jgi:hypothetical protein